MAIDYRNGNYAAFYVAEPFSQYNLGANAAKDFCYYRMLQAWKSADSSFPFNDSHDKNYNVRDSSDWEKTLKPRLHERLRKSKNIILFLSNNTKCSRALQEELDYGINTLSLPIIVVYPDYSEKSDIASKEYGIKTNIKQLWDKLPIFKSSMAKVPTIHVPMNKSLIRDSLSHEWFQVQTAKVGEYYWP